MLESRQQPHRRPAGGEIRSTNVMRDHLNNLLQLVFHTGLPLFLVVVLLILNALLSQSD